VSDYATFLERKAQQNTGSGFAPLWMPNFLFDFQGALLEWAIRMGRAAIFADCGLGKTPMQLVWAQNVVEHTNKPVLILTPLAVSAQTIREGAKFGIEIQRSRDGSVPANLTVTNYEQLHHFNPANFAGCVCDESSILKSFDGSLRGQITEFMRQMPYRLLCTATAAPNDYMELGTSSEALGQLGHMDMLNRFFKNDQNNSKVGRHYGQGLKWRFKGHAEVPFWRWVSSWARAIRRPSDLGFPDGQFVLPSLGETEHEVEAETIAPGLLFPLPAVGLKEQREERRRTIRERCAKVAALVRDHDISMVWCHLNDEGDLLEELIPSAVQVKGSDSEEWKELAALWFVGNKCVCAEPLFSAKLAIWKSASDVTHSICESTISPTNTAGRNGLRRSEQNTTPTDDGATAQTPNTGRGSRRKSRRIGNETRTLDGHGISGNSDSRSNSTTPSWLPRAGDAPFVKPEDQEIAAQSDTTLTTATRRAESADSSVPHATSGSGSSETTPNCSAGPRCICGYRSGRRILISKPVMFGWGLNFQHCAHVTFFPSHSFEQYYQGVRRCWRFGQTRPVQVDVVSTEGERAVLANLQRKARAADDMFSRLVAEMNHALAIGRGTTFTTQERIPAWL